MNKIANYVAGWCIKLLSNDNLRTWFIVNVLRKISVDDVIKILEESKPESITCPKCGCKFEKK